MNRAAAAAAAATGDGPAWQEAALDPQTRADPWELEGACCVLRDIFHQLFPALKSTNSPRRNQSLQLTLRSLRSAAYQCFTGSGL